MIRSTPLDKSVNGGASETRMIENMYSGNRIKSSSECIGRSDIEIEAVYIL